MSERAAPGDCIFCRIAAGEAPCHCVHQDELTITFMDIMPASDGHLMIIPKRHYETLYEADGESLLRIMANSRRIALAMRQVLQPDGLVVRQLNGAAAGQVVFHYHMHLVPRRRGDSPPLHGRAKANPAHLADQADRIAAALQGG
ncbi:MAG: HIT family protein [Deltaproteobacteria bacterium]|nr:HIT family protein [Deltaproteobacteria bacterium]